MRGTRQKKAIKPATAKRRSPHPPRAARDGKEQARSVYELQVHQLELEVQNRSLEDAHNVLEESRARYAELYDAAPVGQATLDKTGAIRELNLAGATLLGRERRSLQGRPLRALLAPGSRRAFDAHLRACFETGRPASLEVDLPGDGGATRGVQLVTVSTRDPLSPAAAVCHAALIDVSERREADRERAELLRRERDARVLAENANRVKEDFLAVVSHELLTPLAPMMLWTKALRSGGASDSLRARAVDAIESCLKVQFAMIADLLDVARGQHGKLRIDLREMDLRPVVSAVIDALAPAAATKQIKLTVELDSEPTRVAGDATRLQQVASNLLSNAFKFTREGGHVAVDLRRSGRDVVLSVRDDGEGISPSLLEGIFEPFRQRRERVPNEGGNLGLGLTIVRQLVSLHGGEVNAESLGLGRGSCFTVRLPALSPPS